MCRHRGHEHHRGRLALLSGADRLGVPISHRIGLRRHYATNAATSGLRPMQKTDVGESCRSSSARRRSAASEISHRPEYPGAAWCRLGVKGVRPAYGRRGRCADRHTDWAPFSARALGPAQPRDNAGHIGMPLLQSSRRRTSSDLTETAVLVSRSDSRLVVEKLAGGKHRPHVISAGPGPGVALRGNLAHHQGIQRGVLRMTAASRGNATLQPRARR